MGRKKGSKNISTPMKAQIVADKLLNQGKTQQEVAKELGINRNTVSKLAHVAMADEEVRARVQRSRDRVVKMLSLADQAYLRTLQYNHPDNFGNQLKAATSIYKTLGVMQDDPAVKITNITPVQIQIGEKVYTIGSHQIPPEARSGVRVDEED